MCWTIYGFMIIIYYCYLLSLYVCLSFFVLPLLHNFIVHLLQCVDTINLRTDYLFDDCRLVFISIKFNFLLFICLPVRNGGLLKKNTHTHTHIECELNNGRTQPTYNNISWSFTSHYSHFIRLRPLCLQRACVCVCDWDFFTEPNRNNCCLF